MSSTSTSPKGPRRPQQSPLTPNSLPSTAPRLSVTGPTSRQFPASSSSSVPVDESMLPSSSNHTRQPVPFPIARSFSISGPSSRATEALETMSNPTTAPTSGSGSNSNVKHRPGSISRSPSPSPSTSKDTALPIDPIPDSLLCRSTFASLEHKTNTLKRLTKSVLLSTSTVISLLEQIERAEDEMLSTLGELGRWLEAGYGVSGGVWTSDGGIRKVKKEMRAKERENLEVMVEHSLRAIKSEIKRQGLAGAGAQSKFEQTAKQYYQQTSAYLSPNSSGNNASPLSPSLSPFASAQTAVDLVQASRTAQFDLARYNHHSTLLYAVPPSSVGCLDLLVGLYGWAVGQLGETPQSTDGTNEDDMRLLERRGGTGIEGLKRSLSLALAQLAQKRSTLLASWGDRDAQTTALEREAIRKQSEAEQADSRSMMPNMIRDPNASGGASNGGGGSSSSTNQVVPQSPLNETSMHSLPVSSAGIENKRQPRKMHKLHRSVGGRLRDLLSSSGSSTSLSTMAEKSQWSSVGGVHGPTRLNRKSIDGSMGGGLGRVGRSSFSGPSHSSSSAPPVLPQLIESPDSLSLSTGSPDSQLGSPFETTNNSLLSAIQLTNSSAISSSTTSTEQAERHPKTSNRHSLLLPIGDEGYRSSFITSPSTGTGEDYVVVDSPTLAEAQAAIAATTAKLNGACFTRVGGMDVSGVGGLNGDGDEDEQREQVGRKKEGVLWGAGSWEGLDKGAAKGKWERFWVVLAHCRIYEYRDSGLGRPETAHAVIDLKFASVREGRGTDRRFVFEIVTPTQGRRLYQATSDSEMKTWVYAICNAIESSINGTSSVRTFDASKLRTASGALDDHALPARGKLGIGFHSRAMGGIGMGLPIPSPISSGMGGANNRRSMPPPSRDNSMAGNTADDAKRVRKTSFRNRIKQSAEAAGGRWSSVVNNVSGQRSSASTTLDAPRPSFLAQSGRMPSYTATSVGGITNHSFTSTTGGGGGLSSAPPSSTSHLSDGRISPLRVPLTSQMTDLSPSSSRTRPSDRTSWYDESVDGDIEKRVMEMAGLGLGDGSGSNSLSSERRVTSEGINTPNPDDFKLAADGSGDCVGVGRGNRQPSAKMSRSRSADTGQPLSEATASTNISAGEVGADGIAVGMGNEGIENEMDPTKKLKRIVQIPGNDRCADCGKSMRSSRWATLSLRGVPMVMFICIRCCGLHRGLGTHISKPRSVDLDIWSPESILLAQKWGNDKGNAIWERYRPPSTPLPTDEEIASYIREKYVEGKWLSPEDKKMFRLEETSGSCLNEMKYPSRTGGNTLIGRAI